MCIIAAKPAGIAMPNEETLRTMWDANPDGAGFMYPITRKTGKKTTNLVQIEKGYMTWEDFKTALDTLASRIDLTATALVMHFRITTHGGTCPELTHPFPVTDSASVLTKPRSTAKVGVAHNGIISSVTPGKGMSDTSEYIRSQLAPLSKALPRFYENADALKMVKNAIGSKMAFLSPEGNIVTIGDFNTHEGMLYSNFSWEPRRFTYTTYGGGWSDIYSGNLTRKLMDVLDAPTPAKEVKLVDGSTMPADCLSFSIDSRGRVYSYSDEVGYYCEVRHAKALTAKNVPITYNAKKAYYETVLDSEEVEAYGYDPYTPLDSSTPWYEQDEDENFPT